MITARDFYIVVGLGKSGLSLVRYLAKLGAAFAVVDTRSNPPELATLKLEYPEVDVRCGALDVEFLCLANVLFVSPGLDLKTPALQEAAKRGVKLSGDIDLFAQVANAPIVAITGSNGKSTVTTLVGEMAKAAGKKVAVGGNLGQAALSLLADDVELYVLELSSFQLESCQHLNAEVATVLNISEDHMDRYASIADYIHAKHRIFIGAKQCVIDADDPCSAPPHEFANAMTRCFFSVKAQPDSFVGFKLALINGENCIVLDNQPLLSITQLKIKGRHNHANAMAALALGKAVNLPLNCMIRALEEFKGLAHRCEWVAEIAGITFYNDSKATNVGAALAAIEGIGHDSLGKLVLIAGGDGKGADFSSLRKPIEQYCRAVVLMGRDAHLIEQILPSNVQIVNVTNMEQAVQVSASLGQKNDVVLLAPACASLDMFSNFVERGNLFMQAVKGLAQ